MLSTVLPMSAQNKSFTVNRNDGASQKYSYSQGDRLVLSREDSQGKKHTDFVEQQVYVGNDVHNIPLTSIESITFDTQATEDEGKTFTVQESGGKIEYGDISIDFPSGTFNSNATVSVTEVKAGDILERDEVSTFYKVTLPLNAKKSIGVNIKSDNKDTDVAVVFHTPGWSTHNSKTITNSNIALSTTYAHGIYSAKIPASQNPSATSRISMTFGLAHTHISPSSLAARRLQTRADIGLEEVDDETEGGEVDWEINWGLLWWINSRNTLDKVEALIDDVMINALATITSLGFKVKGNRKIPIYFADIGDYGQHHQACWSNKNNWIELDEKVFFDNNVDVLAVKRTIIHELSHYFQADYDPREPFTRGDNREYWDNVYEGTSNWGVDEKRLMEAGGVWIEKFADENQLYDPNWESNFRDVLAAPFDVGVYGRTSDADDNKMNMYWGYGSAPMLEYFARKKGDTSIVKLYELWKSSPTVFGGFRTLLDKYAASLSMNSLFDRKTFKDYLNMQACGDLISFTKYGIVKSKEYTLKSFNAEAAYNNIKKVNETSSVDITLWNRGVTKSSFSGAGYDLGEGGKKLEIRQLETTDVNNCASYVYLLDKDDEIIYIGEYDVDDIGVMVISDEGMLKKLSDANSSLVILTTTKRDMAEKLTCKIEVTVKEETGLRIEPDKLEFDADGGSKYLDIYTKMPSFKHEKDKDWPSWLKVESYKDFTMKVTAEPNTSSTERKYTITVYALDAKGNKVGLPEEVEVTQKGKGGTNIASVLDFVKYVRVKFTSTVQYDLHATNGESASNEQWHSRNFNYTIGTIGAETTTNVSCSGNTATVTMTSTAYDDISNKTNVPGDWEVNKGISNLTLVIENINDIKNARIKSIEGKGEWSKSYVGDLNQKQEGELKASDIPIKETSSNKWSFIGEKKNGAVISKWVYKETYTPHYYNTPNLTKVKTYTWTGQDDYKIEVYLVDEVPVYSIYATR